MNKILGGKLEAVILSTLSVPLLLFCGIALKVFIPLEPSVLELEVTRSAFDSVDQTYIILKNHYPVALSPVVVETNIDTSVYFGIQGAASNFRIEEDGNFMFDIGKHEEVTILLVSPEPLSLSLGSSLVHGSYNLVNERGFSVQKEIMVLSDEMFDKEVQRKLYPWGIPTILVLTLIIFITIRQSQKQKIQKSEETPFIPTEEERQSITDAMPPFEKRKEEEHTPIPDAMPLFEKPKEKKRPSITDAVPLFEKPNDKRRPSITDTMPPFERSKEKEFQPVTNVISPSEKSKAKEGPPITDAKPSFEKPKEKERPSITYTMPPFEKSKEKAFQQITNAISPFEKSKAKEGPPITDAKPSFEKPKEKERPSITDTMPPFEKPKVKEPQPITNAISFFEKSKEKEGPSITYSMPPFEKSKGKEPQPITDTVPPFEKPQEKERPSITYAMQSLEKSKEKELQPIPDTMSPSEKLNEKESPPITDAKPSFEKPKEKERLTITDAIPPFVEEDFGQFSGNVDIKTKRKDYKIYFQAMELIPPIMLRDLSVGEHIIRVKRPGLNENITFDVKESDIVSIDLDELFS